MAQVYGILRGDATEGEKATLKALEEKLPQNFKVFPETKIHKDRGERYADFVVLTNYGYIVIEVKDWVRVLSLSPASVTILDGNNVRHTFPPPVDTARTMALDLSNQVKKRLGKETKAAYGHAAVMYRITSSVMIGNMRIAWGENAVISPNDLRNPNQLAARLRNTIDSHHIHSLTAEEMQAIANVIFPEFEYSYGTTGKVNMDEKQKAIIGEKPNPPIKPAPNKKTGEAMVPLFPTTPEPIKPPETPDEVEALFRRTSVRLVRGVAGSGKTVVLIQRAKYMARQDPDRKILVLSFNKKLADSLRSNFSEPNIKTTHFHGLCSQLLGDAKFKTDSSEGWVVRELEKYPALVGLPAEYIKEEIVWIKDNMIKTLEEYQKAERKGRGTENRLSREKRAAMYQLLEGYNASLAARGLVDFADLATIVLDKIASQEITPPQYDMVLIDEAQDFAPSWIKVITCLVKPSTGIIFLADDPTQSIYKRYSWKEKGIQVAGSTVRLTQPYRNTVEIYQMANALLESDQVLRGLIDQDQGAPTTSEGVDISTMRHGQKPLLFKGKGVDQEAQFIQRTTADLMKNHSISEMVVLCRTNKQKDRLRTHLKTQGLAIDTFHSHKGLEKETVFLTGLQECYNDNMNEATLLEEKKLLYMAITRARKNLFLTCANKPPHFLSAIGDTFDQID